MTRGRLVIEDETEIVEGVDDLYWQLREEQEYWYWGEELQDFFHSEESFQTKENEK
jgi:hypothetical protein